MPPNAQQDRADQGEPPPASPQDHADHGWAGAAVIDVGAMEKFGNKTVDAHVFQVYYFTHGHS